MAYDLEEQEKLDALRAWWDRYGTLCAIVIFVFVAAVVGWRGWQWYESHQSNQAMGYFEALETASGQQGDDAVGQQEDAGDHGEGAQRLVRRDDEEDANAGDDDAEQGYEPPEAGDVVKRGELRGGHDPPSVRW
jgi:hypothetical protein